MYTRILETGRGDVAISSDEEAALDRVETAYREWGAAPEKKVTTLPPVHGGMPMGMRTMRVILRDGDNFEEAVMTIRAMSFAEAKETIKSKVMDGCAQIKPEAPCSMDATIRTMMDTHKSFEARIAALERGLDLFKNPMKSVVECASCRHEKDGICSVRAAQRECTNYSAWGQRI